MSPFPDHAQLSNLSLIEEMHRRYLADPMSVDPSWRYFFEGVEFAVAIPEMAKPSEQKPDLSSCRVFHLIQAYRRLGHLLAPINPLTPSAPPGKSLRVGLRQSPGIEIVEEGGSIEEIQPPSSTTQSRELSRQPNPQGLSWWGTRIAAVDELTLTGLGFKEEERQKLFPTLGFCEKEEAPLEEIVSALHAIYASRIGFEYMDLGNSPLEKWVQRRIEPKLLIQPSSEEKHLILESLNKSEVFEAFLHTKYQGQFRFSLEGNETLIPMLSMLASLGAESGMKEWIIGMAHRGRLNVLANLLNKPMSVVFKEFEDTIPYLYGESGDVKYHKGYSADVQTLHGKSIHLHLASNSSCLESVDGIVLGQTKAKQILHGDETMRFYGTILLHGDAAIAGQGVVYETLQMMRTPGFATGGTIHIAVNNQVGYTTSPREGRSTRYCTDIAKTFGCPVFHVNAEDPEACIFAVKLAFEIRNTFQCDVFIDLNGYRKYGHNEGDEPGYTQPLEYQKIRGKEPIRALYIEKLLSEGQVEKRLVETLESEYKDLLAKAFEKGKVDESVEPLERFGIAWGQFVQPPFEELFKPVATRVDRAFAQKIIASYGRVPGGFHLHPKLEKWLQARASQVTTDPAQPSVDWGTAECLAFGSLVLEGIPVRLTGEDSVRGTFSQRHAGWIDQKTGDLYVPLAHLGEGQARFDVYNTILSEYGAFAYEFGYSWSHPTALVIWEAQYGDFVIGAEIPIDHYLVAGEQRWSRYSSLTLILPHDYLGGGPEHSSGRIERFLQLAANGNIQVVYPSTPAQYFHVLRRQGLQKIKKPLVLFLSKGLLRAAQSFSPLREVTEGVFQPCIDDEKPSQECKRLFLCTGKIYYEIAARRKDFPDAAIVRLEQLYPLWEEKLKILGAKYASVREAIWVQEEPENMGAWNFLRPSLEKLLGRSFRYVGRPPSPSPATGSRRKHEEEQAAILAALKG